VVGTSPRAVLPRVASPRTMPIATAALAHVPMIRCTPLRTREGMTGYAVGWIERYEGLLNPDGDPRSVDESKDPEVS
jgi:hypothetical protein